MASPPRGIHLRYTFEARGQLGAEIENPLFDLLWRCSSTARSARWRASPGQSYRHVWGSLKHWEAVLGNPLVLWTQGSRPPDAVRRAAALGRAPGPGAHDAARRGAAPRIAARVRARRRRQPGRARRSPRATTSPCRPCRAWPRPSTACTWRCASPAARRRCAACSTAAAGVAGFHVPRLAQAAPLFSRALRPLLKPGTHKLIGSHWRRQGLMHRPDSAPPRLVDLLQSPAQGIAGLRFVNRQPGSGTRLLLDHLLAQAGLDPTRSRATRAGSSTSHLAVATAVATGVADVGPGIEAAAHEFGLRFRAAGRGGLLPRLPEAGRSIRPAVDACARCSPRRPGRQPSRPCRATGRTRPGEVLSLTQALPWWRFARPKAR